MISRLHDLRESADRALAQFREACRAHTAAPTILTRARVSAAGLWWEFCQGRLQTEERLAPLRAMERQP